MRFISRTDTGKNRRARPEQRLQNCKKEYYFCPTGVIEISGITAINSPQHPPKLKKTFKVPSAIFLK